MKRSLSCTLIEQLMLHQMTLEDLSKSTGMSYDYLAGLVDGDTRLTIEAADSLETALGVPARFWLRLDSLSD